MVSLRYLSRSFSTPDELIRQDSGEKLFSVSCRYNRTMSCTAVNSMGVFETPEAQFVRFARRECKPGGLFKTPGLRV